MTTINHREQRFASFTLRGESPLEIALRAESVLEATPITDAIWPLPAGVSHLEGFMHLRDAIIPVINMKKRLGLPLTEYAVDAKVVVVSIAQTRFGLLFDDIKEVIEVDEEMIQPVHTALTTPQSILTDLIQLDNGKRTVEILDPNRILAGTDTIEQIQNMDPVADSQQKIVSRPTSRHVVFTCKGQAYGIGVEQVQEIAYLEEIDNVFQNDIIEGVMTLRGIAVPVLDAARLFTAYSEEKEEPADTSRVLVLNAGTYRYGLIVDSIDQLVAISQDDIKSLPGSTSQTVMGIYQQSDEKNIMLIQMDRFVEDIQDHLKSVNNRKITDETGKRNTGKTETRHLITADSYLIFSISRYFAIALKDVQEILEPQSLMNVPSIDGSRMRLLNLRGSVVPVLDLRSFYGFPEKKTCLEYKLIVARNMDQTVALMVDDIHTIYKQVHYTKTPSLHPQLDEKKDTLDRLIEFVDKSGKKEHVLVVNVSAILENHMTMKQSEDDVVVTAYEKKENVGYDNAAN